MKHLKIFENDLVDKYKDWEMKNKLHGKVGEPIPFDEPVSVDETPEIEEDNTRYEDSFGGKEYYWNCDDGVAIPEKHKESLREDAEERILYYLQEGSHSGELITSVRFGQDEVPEEDPEDGLSYSGWWG